MPAARLDAVEIGPGLRRLRAPNPGPMTGAGTNTYLLGCGETLVIDPGPNQPGHLEAILRHARGPIRWILVTHTHLDHSPAAGRLAEMSGARTAGRPAPPGDRQDRSFSPDRVLAEGDSIGTAEVTLRAVCTPGHASNHLCYWDPASRGLYTGDHIIDGSTVVIDPPDGNMSDYLASLKKIKSLHAERLLPGHGDPITDPSAAIEALIAHRLRREKRVLDALSPTRAQSCDALLPAAYADVDAGLHDVAQRSLLAHLLKLERDGRAAHDAEGWRRVSASSAR